MRWFGAIAVLLALAGLAVSGCGWKKKEITRACECMVRCLNDREDETTEEEMKCQKRCKGKYYEGYPQGSQMAKQILEGYRADCSL